MYGKRIKELRIENKLTQKEFGKLIHVDFRTVSFWENERYEPNLKQLEAICQLFDVSADYIIGLKNF